MAYYLLTGTDVFQGYSPYEIVKKHLNDEPEPPSIRLNRKINFELESIILKCLYKSPDQRWQTTADLSQALAACGDAMTWDQGTARKWWKENGETFKKISPA